MLWYKAWRESRVRFFISVGAIVSVCLVRAFFEPRFFPGVAHETPGVHNYIQYLYWTIFGYGGRGVLQLSCLLLGLGGLQRDRKQNALGFTLALPISRPRLVVTRALVGFLQILTLSMLPPFILWAISPLMHQSMPIFYGLSFIPFWTIGGFVTFGVTFLCSVLFTGEYTALAVGSLSYLFYLAAAQLPSFRLYPLHVAEFMGGRLGNAIDAHTLLWTGNTSFTLLAGFALTAITLIAASAFITTQQDL